MKQNVFDITPLTYVIDFQDESCDLLLHNFLKFFEMHIPKQHTAAKEATAKAALDIKRILKKFQTSNNNGGHHQQGAPEKLYNYFYTRWGLQETFLDEKSSTYMWLLKPTFLNRGRGIHVFNNLTTLSQLIADYTEGFEEKSLKKQKDTPVLETNEETSAAVNPPAEGADLKRES